MIAKTIDTSGQAKNKLILCAGLQSGGTSIISWCFLQRYDTNGIFDMENSTIYTDLSDIKMPYAWVKMTVGSFRWLDVAKIYEDIGWQVIPLLVIRDVRFVFASLMNKDYGTNGNTAEDPPLRMRFRRYLEDWKLFVENGWPIIRYESFIENPVQELQHITNIMELPWDSSMVDWSKSEAEISLMSGGNSTFRNSMSSNSLIAAIDTVRSTKTNLNLPKYELKWLEEYFNEYNAACTYPHSMDVTSCKSDYCCIPSYSVTRRNKILMKLGGL